MFTQLIHWSVMYKEIRTKAHMSLCCEKCQCVTSVVFAYG